MTQVQKSTVRVPPIWRFLAALLASRLSGLVRDVVLTVIVPATTLSVVLVSVRWINSIRSTISDTSMTGFYKELARWGGSKRILLGLAGVATSSAIIAILISGRLGTAVLYGSIVVASVVTAVAMCHAVYSGRAAHVLYFNLITHVLILAAALAINVWGGASFLASVAVLFSLYAVINALRVKVPGREEGGASTLLRLMGSLLPPLYLFVFASHIPFVMQLYAGADFLGAFYWAERLASSGIGLLGYAMGMALASQPAPSYWRLGRVEFAHLCAGLGVGLFALSGLLWRAEAGLPDAYLPFIGAVGLPEIVFGLCITVIILPENLIVRAAMASPRVGIILLTSAGVGYIVVLAAVAFRTPDSRGSLSFWLCAVLVTRQVVLQVLTKWFRDKRVRV